MIEVALENAEFTSVSPGFKNKLSSLGALDNPDLERELNPANFHYFFSGIFYVNIKLH